MSLVYWVRHGPTHQKTLTGHRDVPADLSDHQAIERLRTYLPPDARVIASDLRRATATAHAIAGPRPCLSPDPDLREIDFGTWDGLHWTEVAEGWPELSRQFWESPGTIRAPEGESWDAAAGRVSAALDRVLADSTDPIIVVAHMGAILTQVQKVLNLTPVEALSHRIDPLSVTVLDYAAGRALAINHIP